MTFYTKISNEKYITEQIKLLGNIPVHLNFDRLQYYGFDQKENKLYITAPLAMSQTFQMQNIFLETPHIHIKMKQKGDIFIQSEQSKLDRFNKKMALLGAVHITTPQENTRLTSKNIVMNLQDYEILFPTRTHIHSNKGSVSSGNLTIHTKEKKAIFSNGVKIRVN